MKPSPSFEQDISLKKMRAFCAFQGVTEERLVLRAYKRMKGGVERSKWLSGNMKAPVLIDGKTTKEVATLINSLINADVTAKDVYTARRDQLMKHPERTDSFLICFMLIKFFSKKHIPKEPNG